jgi:WD40 repeat protein
MKNITCYQLPNFEPISRDMWRYHAATITGLAFSPDGKKLASVAIDTHLMIYQPENITKVTQVKGTINKSLSLLELALFLFVQVLILLIR